MPGHWIKFAFVLQFVIEDNSGASLGWHCDRTWRAVCRVPARCLSGRTCYTHARVCFRFGRLEAHLVVFAEFTPVDLEILSMRRGDVGEGSAHRVTLGT